MHRFFNGLGLLAASLAVVLVTLFMLDRLGRDSDIVMFGVIGCVMTCALCFWASARLQDGPRGGKR